jgi:hypothetical protein
VLGMGATLAHLVTTEHAMHLSGTNHAPLAESEAPRGFVSRSSGVGGRSTIAPTTSRQTSPTKATRTGARAVTDTGAKAAGLLATNPDMGTAELATRLGVSVRTARRYKALDQGPMVTTKDINEKGVVA